MSTGGFWLQHANRQADLLVPFAGVLASDGVGRPGLCLGPLNSPSTLNPLFQEARAAGEAILEPHGHLRDQDHTERARKHFPWLAQEPRPASEAEWRRWIREGLDHQVSDELVGDGESPSFLVTPSPILSASAGLRELYEVLDAATAEAEALRHECWIGVTVDRDYLREPDRQMALANALIALPVQRIVLRAPHRELPPVKDQRYLNGLREVVEGCALAGIKVFLPGSGWLGWLAMAWGAWGFSGGMAAGTWNDRLPGPVTRPDEPSNPYFEPLLLRSVPWKIHLEVAGEPAYSWCGCAHCVDLKRGYNEERAKYHQIRCAHRYAGELIRLDMIGRRQAVRARVDAALGLLESLSRATRQRVDTEHLSRWRALL